MINIWFENSIMIICFEFVLLVNEVDIDPHQLTICGLDNHGE